MDLAKTTIPKSDQINAEDVLLSGPITVTVASVDEGSDQQPANVHLVESPGRCYRPNKTMRKVLVKAWGGQTDAYVGRRMTLYYDPEVKWAGVKVGGIKISHLSHITKRIEMALAESKTQRKVHTVDPLADAPAKPTRKAAEPTPAPDIATITDTAVLRAMWQAADVETRRAIEERVTELGIAATPTADAAPSTVDQEWGVLPVDEP